jgi:hypothetical protein
MKINLVSLTMFSVGSLFLYSAVKGYDPRSVVRWALGGKKPEKMTSGSSDWKDKLGPNEENPDPGQRYPGDKGLPDGTEGRIPT